MTDAVFTISYDRDDDMLMVFCDGKFLGVVAAEARWGAPIIREMIVTESVKRKHQEERSEQV